MNQERFQEITRAYAGCRLAVVGDFCLDRYLEINPAREEISIETGLPVHNVVRVRSQPGGAGTILSNLVALGVGEIWAVGFCGDDGEGMELRRSLGEMPRVHLDHFLTTPLRRTFTYCKPLVMERDEPPRELNRLDSKNWTPTPLEVEEKMACAMDALEGKVDGMILLDQVDVPETGVLTRMVLQRAGQLANQFPETLVLADSRRGLADFPPVTFKMNEAELKRIYDTEEFSSLKEIQIEASRIAQRNGAPVVVTLAEQGMVGANPGGSMEHSAIQQVRGDIDIVGAGDAVTANLAVAFASGASLGEALDLANAGASIVIHQLGTTGAASVGDLESLLFSGK